MQYDNAEGDVMMMKCDNDEGADVTTDDDDITKMIMTETVRSVMLMS